MDTIRSMKNETALGELAGAAFAWLACLRLIWERARRSRAARICAWALLAGLGLTLWTLLTFRTAQAREQARFEAWRERYVNDFLDQRAAEEMGYPPDPREMLLDSQSEALARVLYGVKSNSVNDLRTLCWCVFNRVDNPAYPDSIEAVAAQPRQWMGYRDDNPVLDELYRLAKEQIQLWQNGHRPVSCEFVYMNWTPARIVLRDQWEYTAITNTWVWEG